jgi:hypothetical protein
MRLRFQVPSPRLPEARDPDRPEDRRHARHRYRDAGKFLAEQQLPYERRNDRQRNAGRGFAHSGNKKRALHHADARLVFRAGDRVLYGRHVLAILIRVLHRA